MIRAILLLIILVFSCICIFKTNDRKMSRGVSIAQPHWCPTNVQCDDYMREKVKKSIHKYLKAIEKSTSPYIFSEQFALYKLGYTDEKETQDKIFDDEFKRVFIIEFKSYIPFFQLARREGKPLGYYLK